MFLKDDVNFIVFIEVTIRKQIVFLVGVMVHPCNSISQKTEVGRFVTNMNRDWLVPGWLELHSKVLPQTLPSINKPNIYLGINFKKLWLHICICYCFSVRGMSQNRVTLDSSGQKLCITLSAGHHAILWTKDKSDSRGQTQWHTHTHSVLNVLAICDYTDISNIFISHNVGKSRSNRNEMSGAGEVAL